MTFLDYGIRMHRMSTREVVIGVMRVRGNAKRRDTPDASRGEKPERGDAADVPVLRSRRPHRHGVPDRQACIHGSACKAARASSARGTDW